jgi:hypothetical protein
MTSQRWLPWVFGIVLIIGYLLAMFVFYDRLPEQWSIDSSYLQDLMQGGTTLDADSYGGTAKVLGLIPDSLLQVAILLLGLASIVLFSVGVLTGRAGIAALIMLAPLLLMGLLRPQKEVIVAAMSLAVLITVWKGKNPWFAWAILAFLYGAYGLSVRPYYLLIVVFCGVLYTLPRWPQWLKVLAAGCMICGLWLIPEDIFLHLQGVRDDNNFERVLGELGNRTFFFNPFSPEHPLGFLGNYAYAVLRLNLPVLFSFQPQEIFLSVASVLYGVLVYAQMAWGNARARLMGCLFLAHLLVLWLFEPDLGSYLRHAASAVAYLWPGLILWQKRWVKLPARLDVFSAPQG